MPKQHFDYFDAFVRQGELARKEAQTLLKILQNFDPKAMHAQLEEMHVIENDADMVNHEVYTNIVTEFITPIDREDILSLTSELDEVVDHVEDIMQRLYMYNIQEIIPEAIKMAEIIARSTEALHLALVEFSNYRKSTTINQHIVDVNSLEEEGDRVYIDTVHHLFADIEDPKVVVQWTKTFDRLEQACDSCEHAADVIDMIIMKNT